MTVTFMLIFPLYTHISAWHENLGIDANKAAELYQTKPNDPAIIQWKNALQLAINNMGHCFDKSVISCESYMSTIINNCKSHPNELLACNDIRIAQYPSILKNAKDAQAKAEEEQRKATETKMEDVKRDYASKFKENAANIIIGKCINTNSDTSCDDQLRSLQRDCQTANSTYNYCKDERFVGYLKKYGILNSTVLPYGNLTGNSSSSNSTYP